MRWAWPQNMLAEVAVPGAGVKASLNQKQKHHSASSEHSPTCAMWAEEKILILNPICLVIENTCCFKIRRDKKVRWEQSKDSKIAD